MGNTVDVVRNMKRPRFARSHLPWQLLPKDLNNSKAKVWWSSLYPLYQLPQFSSIHLLADHLYGS